MSELRILAIGDVVGEEGCLTLKRHLTSLKKMYGAHAVIVNGENSAKNNGITVRSICDIMGAGTDMITGGNHSVSRPEVYELLDSSPNLLRPENLEHGAPGKGYGIIDMGSVRVAVISLLGLVFMYPHRNPFRVADEMIKRANNEGIRIIFVDFHAEATSEKRAMGHYLAGRVTAVFGTHTHVQTADEEILKGHTAYISDIGMTGPYDSVLGFDSGTVINKFLTGLPLRVTPAKGRMILSGILVSADRKTGAAVNIKRISILDGEEEK